MISPLNLITALLGIIPALTQQQTNGNSRWGILPQLLFPKFLTNNPLPFGLPWGLLTALNSNPYTSSPNTGVIRYYDFTVKRGVIAPDGYQKTVLLINDQFPGPAIEANWGDTIQVTVNNQITAPAEGTAIHWHGFLQTQTPWFDGVPGVQQCPIAPGNSFTYQFKAELYGTSWYHSHYSGQYTDGVLGPIIIHGPNTVHYDIDLGPVLLTDAFHKQYYDLIETVMTPLDKGGYPEPPSDNNLINGKMTFDCSTVAAGDTTPCNSDAGISKFVLTTGKTHLLRLINAGSEGLQRFSIDGHQLTIIANDFVPIKPYTTTVVTLAVGQRSDVLITANQGPPTASFWMRSNISTICSSTNQPNALAAVYYNNANTSTSPTSTAWDVPDPGTCRNDPLSLTVPQFPIAPAVNPAVTHEIEVNYIINASNNFLWTLDSQSYRADYNQPVLLLAEEGNDSFIPDMNVQDFGSYPTVRVVVTNPTNHSHPMHLHGHNMFILQEGTGTWDGTIVNPQNPQRRDVQLLPANGYTVWQINADNPGVWPYHCHVVWHISAGLYMNILERPEDIKNAKRIPMIMAQTCTDWDAFSKSNYVDQIDSGL